MNAMLNFVTSLLFGIGLFIGVHFIGAAIHKGCADPAEDCPPPIYLAGELGYYVTDGDFNPMFKN